ncbi:uncharacterized protein LOC124364423 [Homalodisca vitripennis]|uniref:uncharacterized protein LOC124364423 n=1 Tax=Homalodisca vitripennis TaxID=197043 RepID=UPI001EEACFB1|nr:uncharacterized protein LOC124364423 [Homalodisca vitripennis]
MQNLYHSTTYILFLRETMMWSVVLALSLSMLLMEVIPTSQQPIIVDGELSAKMFHALENFVPSRPFVKRDVSDEIERVAAMNSEESNYRPDTSKSCKPPRIC